MPITVEHGPNQSRYASIIAESAKQTENYEREKQIAEFMEMVNQNAREYELASRGLDLQEVNQDRMYELGLRESDLAELTQQQGYELGLLDVNLNKDALAQEEELYRLGLESDPATQQSYYKAIGQDNWIPVSGAQVGSLRNTTTNEYQLKY